MSFCIPIGLEMIDRKFECHASWSSQNSVGKLFPTEYGIRLMLHRESANAKAFLHPWKFTRTRKLPGSSVFGKVLRVEANLGIKTRHRLGCLLGQNNRRTIGLKNWSFDWLGPTEVGWVQYLVNKERSGDEQKLGSFLLRAMLGQYLSSAIIVQLNIDSLMFKALIESLSSLRQSENPWLWACPKNKDWLLVTLGGVLGAIGAISSSVYSLALR
ncbi:hypothetical protein Tco_1318197 [Tanacetum coccineum]